MPLKKAYLSFLFACLLLQPLAAKQKPFSWPKATPDQVGMYQEKLKQAKQIALTGGGSGFITRHGKLVMSWGDPKKRYDLKSTTKSFGAAALGLAIADKKIALTDKAIRHHPSLANPPKTNLQTGWPEQITILHLATQTAGFEKPGGYTKLTYPPGTQWHYSDGGPNWLAECLTLIYQQDLKKLMFNRLFSPLGITERDLTWRNNAYRRATISDIPRREFGSGISANVDAMARFGLLFLRGGSWQGKQIIPRTFVDQVRTTVPQVIGLAEADAERHGNASDHYGLLWWNNADGTLPSVPKDAYWSWGLYDSLILVIPSLDIVVSRAGKSWKRTSPDHYAVLQPFFSAIVTSVKDPKSPSPDAANSASDPPYPPSPVIRAIRWAPKETILRKAEGSDNWPLTWADDDSLYTAYGDGWGFNPKIKSKLSLGFARITRGPTDFTAVNIRSATGEHTGGGSSGKKASGLLMIDSILYMWVRNADNAQLAWSDDHAKSWRWSDWKFKNGFGCPTFLNFGKNYNGARDNYVYVYSQDSDSAYKTTDRMVLARVPKDQITRRDAYEFFTHLDSRGKARWTSDVSKRRAVFIHPGRCYRSSVSYNAPLRRYLWWQVFPQTNKNDKTQVDDLRTSGGLGLYDAPEPWGPWTTIYYTLNWDVGPGESGSFPTKWISPDGKTMHLVFSGNDSFSVRQVTLELR